MYDPNHNFSLGVILKLREHKMAETFGQVLGLFLSGGNMVFDVLHFVLLLETLRRKITWKFLHIFFMEYINLNDNNEVGNDLFGGKDSNKKTKNIYGVFLRKAPKKIIYNWIQQFYFE
jgi:hypothetical protein